MDEQKKHSDTEFKEFAEPTEPVETINISAIKFDAEMIACINELILVVIKFVRLLTRKA